MHPPSRAATASARRIPSALAACCRAPISRAFTTSRTLRSAVDSHPPPPPPAGFAALSSRRLISVSGPDSAKFLQGVITANIASNAHPPHSGFYTAFLTAQGRILYDVFIYPDTLRLGKTPEPGTSFLIEVDASQAPALAKHIKRYKLRAAFDVRLLDTPEATVWHLWNDPAAGHLPPTDGTSLADDPSALLTLDPRAPAIGHRLLTIGTDAPSLDLPESTESAYRIRRYLAGVPEGQAEMLRDQALPQESNMDYMNGIDYHKGCYVGQELTIRTKHRGVVRKRILPVVVYGTEETAPTELAYDPSNSVAAEAIPGESKIEAVGKRARNPGKWLSGVGNIGLALCRLETMTDVAGPLPTGGYKEGDEFKVEWDGEAARDVKVKAFVPPWLRKSLEETAAAQTQREAQRQAHE